VSSASDSGAQNDGDAAVEPIAHGNDTATADSTAAGAVGTDATTAGTSTREVTEHTHNDAASDTAAGADAEAAKASREQTVSIYSTHFELYTTAHVLCNSLLRLAIESKSMTQC
jgi:hypothetical protein